MATVNHRLIVPLIVNGALPSTPISAAVLTILETMFSNLMLVSYMRVAQKMRTEGKSGMFLDPLFICEAPFMRKTAYRRFNKLVTVIHGKKFSGM